jgi:hypothetical protein
MIFGLLKDVDVSKVLDYLERLGDAYKDLRREKSKDDPESPGEITTAEKAEILGELILNNMDLVDEDLHWLAEGVGEWLREYAVSKGEVVDD